MFFTVLFLLLLLRLFIWAVSIVGAFIIVVGVAISSIISSSSQRESEDDIDG